jgi:hypothetical protein
MSDNDKDKNSVQEVPDQGNEPNSQSGSETGKEKGLIDEVTDNIEGGAKLVKEKAVELADKLKKGLSQAYATGTKVVDELSLAAQEYTEKYKSESKIRKMKSAKDVLTIQLGRSFFENRLAGDKSAASFLQKKEIVDLLNQIEMVDNKIIDAGKQIDPLQE